MIILVSAAVAIALIWFFPELITFGFYLEELWWALCFIFRCLRTVLGWVFSLLGWIMKYAMKAALILIPLLILVRIFS